MKIKNFLLDLFDILAFLVFVGGIVLFIRFFVFNPYTVVGQSMAPTFQERDFIIVDKITPRYGELKRGNVIVFVPLGKDVPYIKRIIGLAGETVKITGGGVHICSGDGTGNQTCTDLKEDYLPAGLKTEARCGLTEFKVTTGYFVMGDNRGYSTDSMCCFGLGCYSGANYLVTTNDIIGKVALRVYPNPKKF